MSAFRLVFATGPTPGQPVDARMLGWEECRLHARLDAEPGAFGIYVHSASVPELVALVRSLGRDCTVEPFAERQALLRVGRSERTT